MTRILDRAGFALALLFAVVAANSVAIMLSANASHRAFVASQSSHVSLSRPYGLQSTSAKGE